MPTSARHTLLTAALLLGLGTVTAQTTNQTTTTPATTTPAMPGSDTQALPAQTTLPLASGDLTLPYLAGATPVRSVKTASGVAVLYQGSVPDALERYAQALTAAGFTAVSPSTGTSATAAATTPSSTGTADTTGTAGTGTADTSGTTGTANTSSTTSTTDTSGTAGTTGTTDTSGTTGTAGTSGTMGTANTSGTTGTTAATTTGTAGTAGAAEATTNALGGRSLVLERNGQRIRVYVYEVLGYTAVLLSQEQAPAGATGG